MKNIVGVKRKRLDKKKDKVAELRRKLHYALRELRQVVKKAKTFEVQKTLRKLKDARRKDPESDTSKDLGTQIEILKSLDHDQLACSALVTKLKKDKTLFAERSIQAISAELTSSLASPGTPMAKVQNRILSSKVLAPEVTSIVEMLRTFLFPSVGSKDTGKATEAPSNTSKRQRTETSMMSSKLSDGIPSSDGSGREDEDSTSDHELAEGDDGWESGTVDGSAGDSDGEAYDEGGDEKDAISGPSQPRGSKGQSQFLPSLSVGFARGDSGSEISDSELKLVDGSRKNRRGQRARRAIWEKKFGKTANHVKKKKEQAASKRRLPRSIPNDRTPEMGNSSSRAPARSHQLARGDQNTKDSTSDRKKSGRLQHEDKGPLHPSWEAKRKQKIASIVPSQGTKIVFSDS